MKKALLLLAIMPIIWFSCSNDEETQPLKEISASYRLLDKDGNATNVINWGDDMSFELVVTNFTDQDLKFEDEIELMASAFCVYTPDGTYVNCAYTGTDARARPLTIKPGEQFCRRQHWERPPLPMGEYRSPILIKYNGKEIINDVLTFKIAEGNEGYVADQAAPC